MSFKRVLFITRIGGGIGIGHFRRTALLAKRVLDCLPNFSVFLFVEKEKGNGLSPELRDFLSDGITVVDSLDSLDVSFDYVFIDRMVTEREDFFGFKKLGTTVGLDEGGNSRGYFHYLIDSLGELEGKCQPNLFSYAFTGVHVDGNFSFNIPFKKILVTFGGEDPEGLSLEFVRNAGKLFRRLNFPLSIDLVVGPLFKRELVERMEKVIEEVPDKIRILRNIKGISKIVKDYDLMISTYGVSAYESIAAGVPVILFNPSLYHHRLSHRANFVEIGIKKLNVRRLLNFISTKNGISTLKDSMLSIQSRLKSNSYSIEEFVNELSPSGYSCCPVCKAENRAILRFDDRTYFRCKNCGLVYLLNWRKDDVTYDESYFFEEYKKQYGKTYLEDFDFIKGLGKLRLEWIKNILKKQNTDVGRVNLLDIGCAYGAFLQAAKEAGIVAKGIDISREAVNYVRNTLGIDALCVDVDDYRGELGENFGVVTMWYVIEHLKNLDMVLKRIYELLEPGGIFAFSTPNLNGISGLKSRTKFLKESPRDHLLVFNPSSATIVLEKYGFRVEKIISTGIHPNRFPMYFPMLKGVYRQIGKMFKIGDTFEVFAVKR